MNELPAHNLQFTNPIIRDWFFKSYEKPIDEDYIEMGLPINYDLKVNNDTPNKAHASLRISIGEENKYPFFLIAEIETIFNWTNTLGDENTERFILKQSAANILFSYIRPIVSQLTSFAGYDPFIIPFINSKNVMKKEES